MSTGLIRGSIRQHRTAYLAGFVSVFVGSAVLTSFAVLLDIGLQSGVPSSDRTTLIIMSSVVGGWGAVIVAAAVATTMALTTRQRVRELALLRSIGATPRQVIRLITGEAAAVAAIAVLVAAPVGLGGGIYLLHLLKDTGQIADATQYHLGPATFGIGMGAPFAAALIGTWITARRAARRQVRDGLFDAATGGRTVGRVRTVIGWVLLAAGFSCAVTTVTVFYGADPNDSQSNASEGAILSAIGFALLAPLMLERVLPRIRSVLFRAGVAGELAYLNLSQRLQQAATPVMPIVVLTGIATGTLSMQASANEASGAHRDKGTEMLNYVIVGIITALAAAMLINILVAATADRRREYAQTRLLGATPQQVRRALTLETVVVAALGLAAGTISAVLTAVPFSIAQGTGIVPLAAIEIHLAVIVGVVVLTFAATLRSGGRAMSGRAVEALAAA